MKLSGNTILITGGATGIGLGLARALAAENRVLICARRPSRLAQARTAVPALETFSCDAGSVQGRRDLLEWALRTAPDLNVLINNAGVQHRIDLLEDARERGGRYEEIAINLEAPIHLSELLIPHFRRRDSAAIVNITSGLAFVPSAAVPIYCATKAALHSFSLSLRHQLRNTSVRVYEVAPPLVQSELHDHQGGPILSTSGMPTEEFVAACLQGLEQDVHTNLVGQAARLSEKPEDSFRLLNPAT